MYITACLIRCIPKGSSHNLLREMSQPLIGEKPPHLTLEQVREKCTDAFHSYSYVIST